MSDDLTVTSLEIAKEIKVKHKHVLDQYLA